MKAVSSELSDLFYNTLLCEFTTIGRNGPVTTPMQHAWIAERGIFVLSSALGVRFKLDRLQHNRKVSLSFTEFTGSGLGTPDAVLVQGTAEVTKKVSGVAGLEDFWASNLRKKPDQRTAAFDVGLREDDRRLFYLRARIEVVPERVFVLRGDAGAQEIEEVA